MRSSAEAYKKKEQQSWDSFSRRYTQVALPEFRPYGRRLIQLARLRRGMWVLDVATGPGEPALMAAERIGPGGLVVGIDFSKSMLRTAAKRARAARLRNVRFQQMDAENLDFPAMTFDRVFCRFGLMLMPNAEGALIEMHRVLVPGGKAVIAVWSTQRKVNTLRVVREVLIEHDAFEPVPGMPDFFRFGKSGSLERALRTAGFRNVRIERMTQEWVFAGPREFWDSMKQGPSLRRALAKLKEAQREAIKTEVMRRVVQFERWGRLCIPNEAVLAVAQS